MNGWLSAPDGTPIAHYGQMPDPLASLDAAVALVERVLPGCTIDLTIGALSDAQVIDADAATHGNAEDAPAPAIALCLACVRALIAKGEK